MATQMKGIVRGAASAIQGIRRAGDLHERTARTVALAFREDAPSSRAGEPAAAVEISASARDLASAFVDLTKAEALNAASVKVLQTADEMTEELTRVKR